MKGRFVFLAIALAFLYAALLSSVISTSNAQASSLASSATPTSDWNSVVDELYSAIGMLVLDDELSIPDV